MKRKNKYVDCPCISAKKFRLIFEYLSLDLNAIQIAELTGLWRQSINKYLLAVKTIDLVIKKGAESLY